jgi:hypothetical protein
MENILVIVVNKTKLGRLTIKIYQGRLWKLVPRQHRQIAFPNVVVWLHDTVRPGDQIILKWVVH